MSLDIILVYTVVAFLYIISPGPAVVLAILNGIRTGMKKVIFASLGNITGLFVLSSVSMLGLGTLLQTSTVLFTIVKFIGASYLIYLGIKYLKNKNSLDFNQTLDSNMSKKTNFNFFMESFLVAVTNPKPILFFTAIFPQFLNTSFNLTIQFVIMTSIFLTISFFSLITYAYIAKKSKRFLSSNTKIIWFNRITGGIFISMGLGMISLKNHI